MHSEGNAETMKKAAICIFRQMEQVTLVGIYPTSVQRRHLRAEKTAQSNLENEWSNRGNALENPLFAGAAGKINRAEDFDISTFISPPIMVWPTFLGICFLYIMGRQKKNSICCWLLKNRLELPLQASLSPPRHH